MPVEKTVAWNHAVVVAIAGELLFVVRLRVVAAIADVAGALEDLGAMKVRLNREACAFKWEIFGVILRILQDG